MILYSYVRDISTICATMRVMSINRTDYVVQSDQTICKPQRIQLNLVFTLSVCLMKLFVLPAGYILDAYGTLIYRSVATCLMTLALILTAISSPSTSGMLFPAMILLGICGFDLLIGNFQIANLTISARSLVYQSFGRIL